MLIIISLLKIIVNTLFKKSYKNTKASSHIDKNIVTRPYATKTKKNKRERLFLLSLVRVERIELSSQVWKTCILTIVLYPLIRNRVSESNCLWNITRRFLIPTFRVGWDIGIEPFMQYDSSLF